MLSEESLRGSEGSPDQRKLTRELGGVGSVALCTNILGWASLGLFLLSAFLSNWVLSRCNSDSKGMTFVENWKLLEFLLGCEPGGGSRRKNQEIRKLNAFFPLRFQVHFSYHFAHGLVNHRETLDNGCSKEKALKSATRINTFVSQQKA